MNSWARAAGSGRRHAGRALRRVVARPTVEEAGVAEAKGGDRRRGERRAPQPLADKREGVRGLAHVQREQREVAQHADHKEEDARAVAPLERRMQPLPLVEGRDRCRREQRPILLIASGARQQHRPHERVERDVVVEGQVGHVEARARLESVARVRVLQRRVEHGAVEASSRSVP
eukprot:6915257-Prymnesium_polylepis.1